VVGRRATEPVCSGDEPSAGGGEREGGREGEGGKECEREIEIEKGWLHKCKGSSKY